MKIYLIRHSTTEGNRKRRYIGRTDEELCPEGEKLIKRHLEEERYPQAERVYASPMKRCIQTAGLIYPGRQAALIEELVECNFGMFENKNYEELAGCPQYQEWVDSGGTFPFPEGESREEFKRRTLQGFEKSVRECIKSGISSAAYIVHGGTIMCIMERYAMPRKGYYDYQIENGEGYELTITDSDFSDSGVPFGSSAWGSEGAVSSGEAYRASDYSVRTNYKRLFSENGGR